MTLFGLFKKSKKYAKKFIKFASVSEENAKLTPKAKYLKGKKLFENSDGDDEILNESLSLLYSAANNGYPDAQFEMGTLYLYGEFLEKNYDEAFKYLSEACQNGNLDAKWNIAYMYQNGFGVSQNNEIAFNLYMELAEAGNSDAMTQVGLSFLSGAISEQNEEKGIMWLQKACKKNNIEALLNLGNYFYNIQNDEESYKLLLKAANLGSREALNLLNDDVYDKFRI